MKIGITALSAACLLSACSGVAPPPQSIEAGQALEARIPPYLSEEDWSTTEQLAADAMLQYQRLDDWPGQGRMRLTLALGYLRQNRVSDARLALTPMLGDAAPLFSDAQRIEANLISTLLFLRTDELVNAEITWKAAWQRCSFHCDRLATLANVGSRVAARNGQLNDARDLAKTTLDNSAHDNVEYANALRQFGLISLAQKQYEEAKRYLNQALTLDQEAARPRGLAAGLKGLADLAQAQGDKTRASQLTLRALSICGTLPEGCHFD